ncbi:MAG: hypothetical protein IJL67_02155 [Oscillospiraceae bacterium]|nr:hypothetical protein [Oscillospiraceae bacterium]
MKEEYRTEPGEDVYYKPEENFFIEKRRPVMQIYSGYGYGQPVYTVKDDQFYQGYGYGNPVFTVK